MRAKRRCDKSVRVGYARAVPRCWQLFTDDPLERSAFHDVATTLAHEASAAGPPNRLRHVVEIDAGGRRYFLKCFVRTQWKNRLRFATSAPRASDDADRERRVTDALRAAGFGAPRPVAYGRDGATSYYVCAELPGAPLAARIADGTLCDQEAGRAARRCGEMLSAGFHLPDLSADHVFVEDDGQV
ncbi:MAG: hypothetical protein VXY92_13335, partial [Planctomycetota bacterium]|nr:hypothetical protein [Planctomycetota bacterium]